MKSSFSTEEDEGEYELSDQQKKLPQPPLQKPYDENDKTIDLPEVTDKITMQPLEPYLLVVLVIPLRHT